MRPAPESGPARRSARLDPLRRAVSALAYKCRRTRREKMTVWPWCCSWLRVRVRVWVRAMAGRQTGALRLCALFRGCEQRATSCIVCILKARLRCKGIGDGRAGWRQTGRPGEPALGPGRA